MPLWRDLSRATDRLFAEVGVPQGTVVVAVGSYGREELLPFSDVDVAIVRADAADARATEQIIALLQQLWDMGVLVSHAVRTVEETIAAANADHTVAAALLDARQVVGDKALMRQLSTHLLRQMREQNKRGFVEAKLAERDARHAKGVDSRFVLEPHVKDGKGGLRDVHTLCWLSHMCFGRATDARVHPSLLNAAQRKQLEQAYLFFSSVRAQLHHWRGRAEERMAFDAQLELARRMKFRGASPQARAERLMQRYFQHTRRVGELTRIVCAALEEEHLSSQPALPLQEVHARDLPKYLMLVNGRLTFAKTAQPEVAPPHIMGLFSVAQQRGLDIHPKAQSAITRSLARAGHDMCRDGEANRLFLGILLGKAPEITLRRMNEMGVLSAIVPEFSGISGQMQYDGYHTFTVDEHTLVAIGNLAAIEAGLWADNFPLSTRVAKEINDRATLYVAMLCHDIAKGKGGGHAGKGEAITKTIAIRLGLSAEQAALAAWLVKHHLILSETAFKRDLDDPKTLRDFVALVQSPKRLRLLLLVTVADIKAVGPTIWNGWKGALMRELYQRSMRDMGVTDRAFLTAVDRAEQLMEHVESPLKAAAHQLLAQRVPLSWWARAVQEQHDTIAAYDAYLKQPQVPAIIIRRDEFRAVTEITCCLPQAPHLFRVLAGVMAWIGASIVSARIMVLDDGAAIASIGIQDVHGQAFDERARLKQLPQLMADGMAGQLAFDRELPKRRRVAIGRAVQIAPAVFIDNHVSNECTVIEVNAKDRLGLLYDILGALSALELTVVTAHIATYGQKAVDVFYVKNAYGHKIEHPAKLAELQQRVMEYVSAH